MTIDWMAFVIVFGTSLAAAALVVSTFSLGIRFLAATAPPARREDGSYEPHGPSRDDEDDDVEGLGRPRWATFSANVCFGLSAVFVLVGIFLIIPALHFW